MIKNILRGKILHKKRIIRQLKLPSAHFHFQMYNPAMFNYNSVVTLGIADKGIFFIFVLKKIFRVQLKIFLKSNKFLYGMISHIQHLRNNPDNLITI